MIKTALKNFFGSIIYIFVPMGIVYLFVLFALFLFALSAIGSASAMIGSLTDLVSETVTVSGISVSEFIVYAGEKLTWDGNIFHYIAQIIDTNWVQTTVMEFFELLDVSSESFAESFLGVVTEFTESVKAALALSVTLSALGFVLANYATGIVVRRKNARRGFKRWVIANTVIPFVESIVLGSAFALAGIIRYYVLLVFLVLICAYGYLALTSSWIVYGGGKIGYKEVVNVRNLLTQLGAIAIVVLIVALIFVLVMLLNFILAALVIIPVSLYAMNIIKVNSDAYVLQLVEGEGSTDGKKQEAPAEDLQEQK